MIPGEVTAHVARANEHYAARMHPTARRLEHMRWLVRHLTHPGDTVVDPFAGSGTTLLAARDAGRRAIGIELNPDYLPAIYARFEQTTLIEVS
jgi:site-specific DNA-methyltransferase (adenine-specific)